MLRIAPFRKTFSRPGQLGWNPVPTSSSAPTRPRSRASPSVGGVIAGEDLEQGALAGAVVADDPERLAALDLEVDVAKRPELPRLRAPPEALNPLGERLGEQLVAARTGRPDLEALAQPLAPRLRRRALIRGPRSSCSVRGSSPARRRAGAGRAATEIRMSAPSRGRAYPKSAQRIPSSTEAIGLIA